MNNQPRTPLTQTISQQPDKFASGVVIMNDKEEVLLVKRHPEDFLGGYWEMPGGSLNEGETLENSAMRECMEETNLTVKNLITVPAGDFIFHYHNKQQNYWHWCRHYTFFTTTWSGDIQLNPEEHTEFQWIHPEDIENVCPMTPEMQRMICFTHQFQQSLK